MTKEFDARNERKSRSVCAAMAEAADTGKRAATSPPRWAWTISRRTSRAARSATVRGAVMGIRRGVRDLIETVAGFALMAVAFGPRATAMIALEAYRPRWWGVTR